MAYRPPRWRGLIPLNDPDGDISFLTGNTVTQSEPLDTGLLDHADRRILKVTNARLIGFNAPVNDRATYVLDTVYPVVDPDPDDNGSEDEE